MEDGDALHRRIAQTVVIDELRVPAHALPELLRGGDGSAVETAAQWRRERTRLLACFRREIYGAAPPRPSPAPARIVEQGSAFGGRARRLQLAVRVLDEPAHEIDLLVYLPAGAPGRVAVFLGLNFLGNHSVSHDPAVPLATRWMPADGGPGIAAHRATEPSRGAKASRWPVERILARGFGLATADCAQIEPDRPDSPDRGVRAARPDASWGAVAAWAHGLSCCLDALEADARIDAARVIALGHSRLGKAALWAAAQDERFAAAISNESGCLGAALSRRCFGETIDFATALFPHWYVADLRERHAGREDAMPVDQHQLLALVAPRPLYVASAAQDLWADPRGEFLSLRGAAPAYRLLGTPVELDAMPPVDTPLPGRVAYHVRAGAHDLTAWDWERYLDFAAAQVGVGGA